MADPPNPNAPYPAESREKGEQGPVLLHVRTTPDGRPVAVEVKQSSGYARLDRSATETLWKWKFKPTPDDGRVVWREVPMRFFITSPPPQATLNCLPPSIMNERFQTFVYGTAIALMIGWVFYIGRDVFVPIMFSVFVVYVILGLARLIARCRCWGRRLPQLVISILSVLIIALGLGMVVYTILANKDSVIAMAPRYQESLLAAVQRVAVLMRVEAEPTWTTLRRDLLAQVSLQRVVGSALASLSSLFATVIVVALYACFLLVERSHLDVKIRPSHAAREHAQRIKQVIADINSRVGAYLALKTFLGVLLGALSYVIMRFAGLEFAGFWAVMIALLNYVPTSARS